MKLHRFVLAAVGLILGLVLGLMPVVSPGLAATEPAKPTDAGPPTMLFYIAKGGPDSCGRGCDSWIAAEGKIDSEAAARLRTFLRQHRDPKLPLVLNSPGGDLKQALAMGRMLRQQKAVAQVARTSVKECGPGPQTDDSCLKLKQSGRELAAEPLTRGAMCLSACPFVLFGAVTREVAPDAVLGVHSPRITLLVRRGNPSERMREEATERGLDRADRNMSGYLAEMGIDHGLLDITRTVKFESMRVLTRDEIIRFGIDPREFVETRWVIENGNRFATKRALEMRQGQSSYRWLQWRLVCRTPDEFRMDYQRQVEDTTARGGIVLSDESRSMEIIFKYPPVTAGGYQMWSARIPTASVQSLAGLPQLQFADVWFNQSGQTQAHHEKLSTDGLLASMTELLANCPAPAGAKAATTDVKAGSAAAGGVAK